MRKIALSFFLFLLFGHAAHSQGCVVVRNIAGFGQYNLIDRSFTASDWQISLTNRYFEAKDNYSGSDQLQVPVNNQTFLTSYTFDAGITRFLPNGWSISASIPISANSRQNAGEHGGPGTPKHTTHSFGLNDIRVTVYKWLLSTSTVQKFNVQLGLGIKFATGDYKYQDFFYKNDTTPVLAPVNLTLQLGDGGTGIVTELNMFYVFNRTFSLYGNFYYMANPRDQNVVSTLFGNAPTPLQIKTLSTVTSVPDSYSWRVGGSAIVKKWIFSAGVRAEGVPVYDIIGKSDGIRRAGYNMSFEPGALFNLKKVSFYAYVPWYFKHEMYQVVPDKLASQYTGKYIATTGGTGNWMVIMGVLFKL
jgi:hypothetical protein